MPITSIEAVLVNRGVTFKNIHISLEPSCVDIAAGKTGTNGTENIRSAPPHLPSTRPFGGVSSPLVIGYDQKRNTKEGNVERLITLTLSFRK